MSAISRVSASQRPKKAFVAFGSLALVLILLVGLAIPLANTNRVAATDVGLQQAVIRTLHDAGEIVAEPASHRLMTSSYSSTVVRAYILSPTGDVLAEALGKPYWHSLDQNSGSLAGHPLFAVTVPAGRTLVDTYTVEGIDYRGAVARDDSFVVLVEVLGSAVIRPIRQLAEIASIVVLVLLGASVPALVADLVGLQCQ